MTPSCSTTRNHGSRSGERYISTNSSRGNPLDIGIQGDGFFQVTMPNGQLAYTRDGSFQISDQGTLVTSEGLTVAPGIKIPSDASSVNISSTGIVSVTAGSSASLTEVGRIELARFANPSGLQSMGGNLFQATAAAGEPTTGYPQDEGLGRVQQGYLESSNVEIVQEMVDMISAMRAYEVNSKAIKNSESMAEVSNNLIR